MARRVFFSFHYENDINRAMIVRNSWVTQGTDKAGFVDKAEFETIKRKGDKAVENWIDEQMNGTSVTVVLLGSETLSRQFVQYEIRKSLERGNAIIGVKINNLKDMNSGRTSALCNLHTCVGRWSSTGNLIYFDEISDGIYDYVNHNGYENMGSWIENAAKKRGK